MSRPTILLTRRWPAAVEAHLAERYLVTANVDDVPLTSAQLAAGMRSHDAICPTVTDRLGAAEIDAPGRHARIVANFGAGYEHIDLDACRITGVAVTNTPGVLTDATAELTLTLMLMAARRAGEGERLVRAGAWTGWGPTQLLGHSLVGKRLGLIGYGRIAQAVGDMARAALGMTVSYWTGRPERGAAPDGAQRVEDLGALLADADVVSLHCPGGAATHHLIDARRLSQMKPHAVLINTARGSVVDEAALAEALAARRIGAAGLDVYASEPAVAPALLALDNVVLLPHLGSATEETRTAMGMLVAENLDLFFAGAPLRNRVA
ncbi:MAG: 2-hydroxyacid dehydrogenase [Janthinobacterium lividum]